MTFLPLVLIFLLLPKCLTHPLIATESQHKASPISAESQLSIASSLIYRFGNISIRNDSPVSGRAGLNRDACNQPRDCYGSRVCLDVAGVQEQKLIRCAPTLECQCFPTEDPSCTSSNDCDAGESCVTHSSIEQLICVSTEVVESTDAFVIIDEGNEDINIPDADIINNNGTALTLDVCETDSDCAGNRSCALISTKFVCIPKRFTTCSATEDCASGEICSIDSNGLESAVCASASAVANSSSLSEIEQDNNGEELQTGSLEPDVTDEESGISDQDFDQTNEVPVNDDTHDNEAPIESINVNPDIDPDLNVEVPSEEVIPSLIPVNESPNVGSVNDDEDDVTEGSVTGTGNSEENIDAESEEGSVVTGVCFDANALGHLDRTDLVYPQHQWANVLCDNDDSCATAGHMVVWKKNAMMMKRYCEMIGGCAERKMLVNSPKWAKALRIKSKTMQLEYTAYAAMYQTHVEEKLLRVAVHAGF